MFMFFRQKYLGIYVGMYFCPNFCLRVHSIPVSGLLSSDLSRVKLRATIHPLNTVLGWAEIQGVNKAKKINFGLRVESVPSVKKRIWFSWVQLDLDETGAVVNFFIQNQIIGLKKKHSKIHTHLRYQEISSCLLPF